MNKLLTRQLARINLSFDNVPDLSQWQAFLKRLDRTFEEIDQERYLTQRAMEISSSEMMDLNEKLEDAQRIAQLGYWMYDRKNETIIWSQQLYEMLHLRNSMTIPSFDILMSYIYEPDREQLATHIDAAFNQGLSYEMEFRMKPLDGSNDYHWYFVVGHPHLHPNVPVTEISGILMDITKRKIIEEELSKTNSQLIHIARRAGMADVATAILHNVGNILNSANVSIGLIQEYTNHAYLKKLSLLQDILQQNTENLLDYLLNDPKGKHIPEYLTKLTQLMYTNLTKLVFEVNNLKGYLEHIKEITNIQKNISGISGIYEKLSMTELIEIALNMCGMNLPGQTIQVIQNVDPQIVITTDKTKVLQILCNLIQNAKDALLMSDRKVKNIYISSQLIQPDDKIHISVQDTGMGISSENLQDIFKFGFTTKKTGHGFGLHSSALAAKELDGVLEVNSEGVGKGATFTLTLPLNPKKEASIMCATVLQDAE